MLWITHNGNIKMLMVKRIRQAEEPAHNSIGIKGRVDLACLHRGMDECHDLSCASAICKTA